MRQRRRAKEDLATRKHHIIKLGDLELCNGFGIRYDCAQCSDGVMIDGKDCWICHSADNAPTKR